MFDLIKKENKNTRLLLMGFLAATTKFQLLTDLDQSFFSWSCRALVSLIVTSWAAERLRFSPESLSMMESGT